MGRSGVADDVEAQVVEHFRYWWQKVKAGEVSQVDIAIRAFNQREPVTSSGKLLARTQKREN